MQLHLVPSPEPPQVPGTPDPTTGVEAAEGHPSGLVPALAVARRRPGPWSWVALAVSCGSLLGQGERCHVDPRFGTPSATLTTYWEALWADDEMAAVACFAEPADAVPVPGSLWFLPPCRALSVSSVRLVPVDAGRLVASYQVRFRPFGSLDEHGFDMASELLRTSGGWRIVRVAVGTDLPEWRPIPHRVDI